MEFIFEHMMFHHVVWLLSTTIVGSGLLLLCIRPLHLAVQRLLSGLLCEIGCQGVVLLRFFLVAAMVLGVFVAGASYVSLGNRLQQQHELVSGALIRTALLDHSALSAEEFSVLEAALTHLQYLTARSPWRMLSDEKQPLLRYRQIRQLLTQFYQRFFHGRPPIGGVAGAMRLSLSRADYIKWMLAYQKVGLATDRV